MPPPRITKAFVNSNVEAFDANVDRARDLYRKIVLHGYTGHSAATSTRLNNPDTRDAAQFIFFEIAAKFEDFAKTMFQAEVRSVLNVTVAQSPYIMGDPDNGLDSKLGWGSPQKLKERGQKLLRSGSFFGDLDTNLGSSTYTTLIAAHTVRNRIAHTGGQAQAKFVKHLIAVGIPTAQRMGMSIGRFLRDFPIGATPGARYFFVYLDAYSTFAAKAKAALP